MQLLLSLPMHVHCASRNHQHSRIVSSVRNNTIQLLVLFIVRQLDEESHAEVARGLVLCAVRVLCGTAFPALSFAPRNVDVLGCGNFFF